MKQTVTILQTTPQTDSVRVSHSGDSMSNTELHAVQPARQLPAVHYNTEIPETLLRPNDSIFLPDIDTSEYLLLCYDSTFAAYEDVPVRQRESMFIGNSHHKGFAIPETRYNQHSGDWIFVTIMLLFTFVSIYINNQKFKLRDIFQSLFDTRVLDRVFRESNIRTSSLLPMVGIYLASVALMAIKLIDRNAAFVTTLPDYLMYLAILGGLIAFIFLKNSLIRLLGNVFEDRSVTMLYISSNNLFYFVGGFVFVPLMLLLFYCPAATETTLKTTIFLVGIIFIVRLFRGIQLILTNSKTSKLYLFYYLCIFEIVPILVMAKIVLL